MYNPLQLQKSRAHPLLEHAVLAHRMGALCAGHASLALPSGLHGRPVHGLKTGVQARVT